MLRGPTSLLLRAAANSTFPAKVGPFTLSQPLPYVVMVSGATKLNLIDDDYMNALQHIMTNILSHEAGAEARVAILTAPEGAHFSAGLNLKTVQGLLAPPKNPLKLVKHFLQQPAQTNQQVHQLVARWQEAISSVARCRIPVIAAIDKSCIGGAVDLATACDFRYTTAQSSKFSVREAKVGIAADIGTLQRLPALVGQGRARELALTARDFSGTEAAQMGLVEGVFDSYSALQEGTLKAAEAIAKNSPLAVQGTKAVLNLDYERNVQFGLDSVRLWSSAFLRSDDLVAAAIAFARGKEPKFGNRVLDPRGARPLEHSGTGSVATEPAEETIKEGEEGADEEVATSGKGKEGSK